MARKGIQNVNNGWYYLNQIGKLGGFVQYLNENILKRLNGVVYPDVELPRNFRKKMLV